MNRIPEEFSIGVLRGYYAGISKITGAIPGGNFEVSPKKSWQEIYGANLSINSWRNPWRYLWKEKEAFFFHFSTLEQDAGEEVNSTPALASIATEFNLDFFLWIIKQFAIKISLRTAKVFPEGSPGKFLINLFIYLYLFSILSYRQIKETLERNPGGVLKWTSFRFPHGSPGQGWEMS